MEFQRKKRCLEKDIEELVKSADKYAEEAEDSNNLTLLAKSNSLRKTAKEKQKSLFELMKSADKK